MFGNHFSKIYVITLDGSERQKLVIEKLTGVDFEFFHGIDGRKLTITKNEDGTNDVYSEEYGVDMKHVNNWYPRDYGCSLSHLKLYEKIRDDKTKGHVLILEDDFDIDHDKMSVLDAVFSELPEDYDLLYLGFNNGNNDYDRLLRPNFSQHLFRGAKYDIEGYNPRYGDFIFLEGTNAIVVNNRFCEIMIRNQSDPSKFFTADGAVMYHGARELNYYAVVPQLMPQDQNIKHTY